MGRNKYIKKAFTEQPKPKSGFVDPSPKAFYASPEAVTTDLAILKQIRQDEQTLIWGLDDALPLHILTAIAESPTTTACIGKLEMFTKGSGFSDQKLMDMVINKEGDTLWDLHCAIVAYYVALDGFTVNFKYSNGGKIQNVYVIPTEMCRYMAKQDSTEIEGVKYNPYFGTKDYQQRYTTKYSIFDPTQVKTEYNRQGNKYQGQLYFHSTRRTLYKHYPVPKFWSAKEWILADHQMGVYTNRTLSNSFFQSALMKVIGDPNALSMHPNSMKIQTGTDGVQRKEPTKTNGEIFNEMMAANFSGVEKAGTVMAFWSQNKEESVDIQAFPNNTNFDQIDGTLMHNIRMISLATEIPGILANLPDTASPLSGSDALPKAIDFVQTNTAPRRAQLEKFYNTILIPNLQEGTKAKVKIEQYAPTKTAVTIDDKFWEFMNEAEKIDFIEKNEPAITIIRQDAAKENTAPATTDENGNVIPAPTAPQQDENIKNLKVAEINRIMSYVKKYEKGQITLDQAKQLLGGFGLSEEQQAAWLQQ